MEPTKGTRYYGGNGTIHGTTNLDIETRDGRVVAVWFRCQALPFHKTEVRKSRAEEMERMYRAQKMRLDGVTLFLEEDK